MGTCEYHIAGGLTCGSPATEKYLGLWACQAHIERWNAMWQKAGELGIFVRSAGGKVPRTIAKQVRKGEIRGLERLYERS